MSLEQRPGTDTLQDSIAWERFPKKVQKIIKQLITDPNGDVVDPQLAESISYVAGILPRFNVLTRLRIRQGLGEQAAHRRSLGNDQLAELLESMAAAIPRR